MSVEWRPVPTFEGVYEVSSGGQVRSLTRTVCSRNGGVRTQVGRVLRQAWVHGYAYVCLWRDGMQTHVRIHRLVCEAFHGPCPPKQEARHLNGHRADNRAENLAWGTPRENAEDKRKHGTLLVGSGVGDSVLTEEDVARIKQLRSLGVSQKDCAAQFGVSRSTISFIDRGKRWAAVTGATANRKRLLGETHHQSKLSEHDVQEIRAARSQGESLSSIAKRYEIHFGTVSKICLGRIWAHVPAPKESAE